MRTPALFLLCLLGCVDTSTITGFDCDDGGRCFSPDGSALGGSVNGEPCTTDFGCASSHCQLRRSGSGKVCIGTPCPVCEGVAPDGTCAAMDDGASCEHECSSSTFKQCCASRCVCSATAGICP